MSDPHKVKSITLEEAQAAMELGIHIGIASWGRLSWLDQRILFV